MAGKKTFQPGDVIIKAESNGTSAYIIERGTVEVSAQHEERKVVLGYISKDEIFGEIGLLEDTPRTATVTALDKVVVIELDRDDFNDALLKNPKLILPIMKAFFERLRQLNRRYIEASLKGSQELETALPKVAQRETSTVTLSGMSDEAREALNGEELCIERFPFKVGREPHNAPLDVLCDNDLYLRDRAPYNVSRNHFSLNQGLGQFYLVDRGSRLGTILNGQRVGKGGATDRVKLHLGESLVVVGSASSPFHFRLVVQ